MAPWRGAHVALARRSARVADPAAAAAARAGAARGRRRAARAVRASSRASCGARRALPAAAVRRPGQRGHGRCRGGDLGRAGAVAQLRPAAGRVRGLDGRADLRHRASAARCSAGSRPISGQKSGRRGGLLIGAVIAAAVGVPAALFPIAPSVPPVRGRARRAAAVRHGDRADHLGRADRAAAQRAARAVHRRVHRARRADRLRRRADAGRRGQRPARRRGSISAQALAIVGVVVSALSAASASVLAMRRAPHRDGEPVR